MSFFDSIRNVLRLRKEKERKPYDFEEVRTAPSYQELESRLEIEETELGLSYTPKEKEDIIIEAVALDALEREIREREEAQVREAVRIRLKPSDVRETLKRVFWRTGEIKPLEPAVTEEEVAEIMARREPSYAEKLAEVQAKIAEQEKAEAIKEEQIKIEEETLEAPVEANWFYDKTQLLKRRKKDAITYFYYQWKCTCQVSAVKIEHIYATKFFGMERAKVFHNDHYPDHRLISIEPLSAYEREMKE